MILSIVINFKRFFNLPVIRDQYLSFRSRKAAYQPQGHELQPPQGPQPQQGLQPPQGPQPQYGVPPIRGARQPGGQGPT